MRHSICFLLTLSIYSTLTFAQNHIDALRYSQESLWGSARYVSMGGAFGALGANATNSSHNPAGLALYTTNEFSTSLSFNEIENQSNHHQQNSFDKKNKSSLSNISYISANIFNPEDVGDWNRFNFSIGYNILEDYNRDIFINAQQSESALVDYIIDQSNNTEFQDLYVFRELLAFNTYLIDTINGSSNYFSTINGSNNKNQSYQSQQSGSKNEYYLSFGTAYQNKLFLGATLGFPSITYSENTSLRESEYSTNSSNSLHAYDYNTSLYVSGSGINLKLGLIYKLDKNIRYGLSIHTPTYYELNEEYSSSINTEWIDTTLTSKSYLGVFEYSLNTPFKITNSLSFVLKKRALISVDYEYLNFSSSELSSISYSFDSENNLIEEVYSAVSNIRFGTEFRVHEQLSLRAGYAYYQSPFSANLNDQSKEFLTMGLGFKINQYFIDFAMINSISKENFYLYEGSSPANLEFTNNRVLISAGLKF